MNSWEQIGESMVRLLLAMVLGGVIGWQRESADKPAGFRTHILVSVGAALFTLVSAVGFFGTGADPARVASNIVVGIGFLGAGTVWRGGSSEHSARAARSRARSVRRLARRLPPPGSRDELLMALADVEGAEDVRWEDANAAA